MFSRSFIISRLSQIIKVKHPTQITGIRNLFSPGMLGIDNFAQTREHMIERTQSTSERFRTKMNEFSDPNSSNLVFTEDLKLMCYLAENNEDDLTLLTKMIKKFHTQNKELRFGTFSFGPVIMRLFSFFNKPKEALKVFYDPETEGFFDQVTSFVLLLDLLFRNEMYQEVCDVYDAIRSKQIQNMKYPRNVMLIVFAALYKLNTPESYQKSLNLLKELKEAGHQPVRRLLCFVAASALKQNQPHIAVEILSLLDRQGYITVRNLKAQALAELGRPDDALPILRSYLNYDIPDAQKKGSFCKEVVDKIEEAVIKMDKKEVTLEFTRIKQILMDEGHLIDHSIDHFLLAEIDVPMNIRSNEKQYFEANYSTRNPRPNPNKRKLYQRPGLRELM